MKKKLLATTIIFSFLLILFQAFKPSTIVKSITAFQNIYSSQDLNDQDLFSFSVISDNHGASPYDNIQMYRTAKWIAQGEDKFVLGLGDHMVKNESNNFLHFILRNEWWKKNFYPTIADGENAYFGSSQSDWGAGGQLLEALNFKNKFNTRVRENGAEYYTKFSIKGVNIHYISLHYPDEPYILNKCFPIDSRNYLINTLNNIQKSNNDIIIVAAHSRWGSWIDDLNESQKNYVMSKCDLLLSGTTHYFERRTPQGFENRGALVVNASSVNRARFGNHNGFLKIHVMKNPLALVVQHVNTNEKDIQLMNTPDSYVKYINGGVYPLNFENLYAANFVANTY